MSFKNQFIKLSENLSVYLNWYLYWISIYIISEWVSEWVAQSCPTLCDPKDGGPPGSSVRGIFQARILQWVAIPFSRGSSPPRYQTWVSHIASRLVTIWATREDICIINMFNTHIINLWRLKIITMLNILICSRHFHAYGHLAFFY